MYVYSQMYLAVMNIINSVVYEPRYEELLFLQSIYFELLKKIYFSVQTFAVITNSIWPYVEN